jgi:hypothetical protein
MSLTTVADATGKIVLDVRELASLRIAANAHGGEADGSINPDRAY